MESIRSEFLPDFPIVVRIPVAWGEMDAYGHVNNIVFFRHFESARIALLDAIDFRDPAHNNGIGPILASTQCRFRRPIAYPDTLLVGARIRSVEDDRFEMEYRLVSLALQGLAADGSGMVVAYRYEEARKASLPAAVRARIEGLEQFRARDTTTVQKSQAT
ncbi:MAG: acyl-CoA thioesterase [Longimicrobiales bacterium]